MLLSTQMTTPGTSSVSAAARRARSAAESTVDGPMSHAGKPTTLHQKSDELWTASLDEGECRQIVRDMNVYGVNSEFLRIRGSACLMNVSTVHVGPVNGSSNVMKQPFRRGKWPVYLNRNVSMQ